MALTEYLDEYTSYYPPSAAPDEGYIVPSVIAGAVYGASAGDEPKVLDGFWEERSVDPLWSRFNTSQKALTFYKVGSAWFSSTGSAPSNADTVVGGGYRSVVTLTQLDEMLSDGVINQTQYDGAVYGT